MLGEYVKNIDYARFHTHSYHCCSKMLYSSIIGINLIKSLECIMLIKGTVSWCVLKECITLTMQCFKFTGKELPFYLNFTLTYKLVNGKGH